MKNNPFLETRNLNLPLQPDICQQIHYTAVKMAANQLFPEWQKYAHYWGNEMLLAHPVDIELAFNGVTSAIYHQIAELYCNRLERSIPTVYQILERMAAEAHKPAVSYEAVWAICLYLEERRQESCEVTANQTETEWSLIQLRPAICLSDFKGQEFSPTLLGVFDTQRSVIIAFRFVSGTDIAEATGLIIYNALISQRVPSMEGATGLSWSLPAVIDSPINLPQNIQQMLHQLGIGTSSANRTITLPDSLKNWGNSLAGQVLGERDVVRLFDFYLHQTFGHAPLRMQRNLTYKLSHLTGYSRDPAWQFPALRQLLPEGESIISAEGQVEYDGLHYEDPLLKYWAGHQISLRRSEYAEATAWIYLNGDVLCLATARELRRNDGSYRLNRSGRD